MNDSIERRKSEHIDISLHEKVTGDSISTGLESLAFIHNALPEINFNDISLETEFLGFQSKTPFLISSMTGGTELAEMINRHLASAAEERGWVFALGSTRALLDSAGNKSSFLVRKYAPTIPLIANLGAVQLNYGYGVNECRTIIEQTEADMLVLHLNSIQEVIQPEGDTDFSGLLKKIARLCEQLDVPIGVKEVGWGIDAQTATRLREAGVAFIDVAGAGGTSWSQVEKFRAKDPIRRLAADAFSDWGIPTVESLRLVREALPDVPLIASGGLKTGLDGAKTLALRADLVGFGRTILQAATENIEAVLEEMAVREFELKMAMFGIGVETIAELKKTTRLVEK